MKKSIGFALAALLIWNTTAACYNTARIAPPELYKLNGFREGQETSLQTVDGGTIDFNKRSKLIVEKTSGEVVEAKVASADVNGSELDMAVRPDNAPLRLDVTSVNTAEVKNFSIGKTVGLGVGLGVGIPTVLVITIVVVVAVLAAKTVTTTAR